MTPEQALALRKPFDPKTIGKLAKAGLQLDFVGHAAVTDRLLAVDPAWTWEPLAVDEHGMPAYQNGCLWIRLTVCGVTRIGVGDGPDPKQRIGDAIRNAAMRFGVALDLWSRQELEGVDPNGGDPTAQPLTAEAFHDKHRKAERGVTPPEQDEWARTSDEAVYKGLGERIGKAQSREALNACWQAMKAAMKDGLLVDVDADTLTEKWKHVAKSLPAEAMA